MEQWMGPDHYQWTSMSHDDQLKEVAMQFIRLCAEQGDGDSPRQPCLVSQPDPYAKASVASFARHVHHPVKVRQPQAEPTLQPATPEDSSVSRKPIMKRKVLRHTADGEVQVTDESVVSETQSSSPSDPEYSELSQNLKTHQEEEPEEECEQNSSSQSETPSSLRATEESQSHSSQRWSESRSTFEQDLIFSGHPKSFIPPKFDQLSRNRMKTDRVARYLEHKHDWELLRLPGEDPRKGVRWSIREQMQYKSELPPRAHHVYIPNNYLVPTEKKRSALRWGIRCDLANGVIPRYSYSS
ncbi:hydrolethalus syndrome protein 1 [Sceloporus undulatus]|uniref:hydrolethalus syndrome protein 1 n=1 Tax=Sceloporus undulatus TaxID=8520 RepID=UPI001C4B6CD5|nr:hydrolethalus syndrome protein 1 [Sceloporus undulatus]XP_042330195.1 hydrolethalus syndrome protein 1 [Sceloporus undulatus]XP_042330196.1 hydrolethalus syndrome protein 1 [Sceloporus undulatus]